MLDLLEPRLLLAVVVTDYEQYFLELLNRARLNPAGRLSASAAPAACPAAGLAEPSIGA